MVGIGDGIVREIDALGIRNHDDALHVEKPLGENDADTVPTASSGLL